MAIAKEDILNAIAEMSVMDIVDLMLRRLLLARLPPRKNKLNLMWF